jgi:hypothetical protein
MHRLREKTFYFFFPAKNLFMEGEVEWKTKKLNRKRNRWKKWMLLITSLYIV